MARLDIGGTKIDISDDFLKLSPQAQDTFVKTKIIPSQEFQAAQKGGKPPQQLPDITVNEDGDPPPPPPDDHGLARRQAMSPVEKAVSPATEYPRNYSEMRNEGSEQFGRGLKQIAEGWNAAEPGSFAGAGTFAKGAANTALGALGYTFSPLSALYRSVAGQPVEDVTGIPREYTEFGLQLATPGIGLTGKTPAAMPSERALMSERPPPGELPTGPPPIPETEQAQRIARQQETLGAAERLKQINPDLVVPDAISTESRAKQLLGQATSKVPIIGDKIGRAVEDVPVQLGETRNAVADQFGQARTPENVASDIADHLKGTAAAETKASEDAARLTDEAARAEWQRTNQEREQYVADAQARAAREASQQVGDVPTTDMGQTVIDTVRANHEVARANKDAAYASAAEHEGTLYDPAVSRADRFVSADLRTQRGGQGIVDVDPTLTPAASRMQDSLAAFSERARQRVAQETQRAIEEAKAAKVEFNPDSVDPTGVNLRTIERQRQILNAKAANATTPGDRRAAGRIMNAFDEWQQRAMSGPHYEGDADALATFQRARAANRDFRQRFGYNDRNDADTLLNKIVQPGDQVGANEIANGMTGAPDKGGRLLDAVYGATGDHPNHANVVQAVRGGFWNKLSGTVEGATETRSPTAIQKGIREFTRGKGRDLAARVFSPEDQALMERHGDVLAAAERARPQIAAQAKLTEPVATEIPKGPAQQLADRVLGKGEKPDEAVYRTLEGYAKSKSSRDLATLAEVVRNLPPDLKGNLLNTFIRRMGVGVKDEFSAGNFAKEWNNLNPGAKAILTGNAGAHVRALDDIATVAQQFDLVHRRFGNPSGSGAHVNIAHYATKAGALAAAVVAGKLLGTLPSLALVYGAHRFSKVLAAPQSAASVARLSRQMLKLQSSPTIANAAAATLAMRNLRNTAAALGIHEQQD